MVQVVGGTDEHLPRLPSNSHVKLISFEKLLSQVLSKFSPHDFLFFPDRSWMLPELSLEDACLELIP